MKLRNLFFASLAMVTFAACSNDDEPAMPDNNTPVDAKALDLTLTTKNLTKADPNADENAKEGNEIKIKSLKVYIFEGVDNTYFAEKEVTLAEGGSVADAYEVTIDRLKTTTPYTLVAIANPHGTLNTTNLAALESSVVEYDAQFVANEGFTMSGSTTITATELVATDATEVNADKTINISRRLAAIELANVKIKLPANTPENFKLATATLQSAYMVNVREAAYMGSDAASDVEIEKLDAKVLYGAEGAFGDAHTSAILNTKLAMTIADNTTIAATNEGTNFTNTTRIYAFPTDGTRTIEGKQTEVQPALKLQVLFSNDDFSETRYYTIFINGNNEGNKIKNNALYQISATITGLGSKDDNTVEETAKDVTANIIVKPWEVKTQDEGNLTD